MRFRFIDALRGIAALAVLFAHVTEFGRYNAWLHLGVLGVPVFFVISGFVIAASNADQNLTANYIGRFILRRSLRLDPPYWMMVLIVIAFVSPLYPADTLANMFYLHRILDAPSALNVAWTLCLEVQLYLFFVLSAALFQKLPGNAWVTAAVAQGAFAVFSAFTAGYYWHEFFVPYWYQFFAGVIAYWCVSRRLHWGFAAAFLALVLVRLHGNAPTQVVVVTAALLVALGHRMTTLLSSPVPQFFGRISYSLYLTHVPFYVWLCEVMAPGPLRAVTAVAGSIVAGWIMYQLVERTALGWSARVAKTAPPAPARTAGGEAPAAPAHDNLASPALADAGAGAPAPSAPVVVA